MDTGKAIAENLERLIAEKGTNNRAVAEKAGLGHTAVRDIITRKVKNPTYATLVRLAEVLECPVTEIIGSSLFTPAPLVPIVGKVGAGARVPLVDAFEKGDGIYHLARPPQLPNGKIIAVEVEGDSMTPMYQPGHILFFTRHAHDAVLDEDVGKPCVIEDSEGMAWVKLLKRGSATGLWNLISLNSTSESVWDVKVKWAARVVFALPAELSQKI